MVQLVKTEGRNLKVDDVVYIMFERRYGRVDSIDEGEVNVLIMVDGKLHDYLLYSMDDVLVAIDTSEGMIRQVHTDFRR